MGCLQNLQLPMYFPAPPMLSTDVREQDACVEAFSLGAASGVESLFTIENMFFEEEFVRYTASRLSFFLT